MPDKKSQDFCNESTVGYDTAHILRCQVILFAGLTKEKYGLCIGQRPYTHERDDFRGGEQPLWSIGWGLLNIPYIEGLLYIAHSHPVSLFALLLATNDTVQPYH